MMIKPQLQTSYTPLPSSPSPAQSLGGRFVEIAVITAPPGQSDAIPETPPAQQVSTTVAVRPKPKPFSTGHDHETMGQTNEADSGNWRPGRETTAISVNVIVDDQHELFFNGQSQGWKDGGYSKKFVYDFKDVKSGDVLAIRGKDTQGYAGILAQVDYKSGPDAGSRHATEAGWTCSRHKPKDESWKTSGFTNTGKKYDMIRRFVNAKNHGKIGSWPWGTQGDISTFDSSAVWFWTEHNFVVNQVWCRYEFDFTRPQGDTGSGGSSNDDDDDDRDKGSDNNDDDN
jgi:hypothetical protein